MDTCLDRGLVQWIRKGDNMSKMGRNGVILQGVICGHMVRITEINQGGVFIMFGVTIGLHFCKGNTHPDYKEIICKNLFNLAQDAWVYGKNIAQGASSLAEND